MRATALAADWAHENGLWLEAELGEVGGKDGAHAPGVRTDPAEAARYVGETGVDGLAVAVGSSHAMTARTAQLDHELIAALRDAVPVPLVLHGSSGVADDELAPRRRSRHREDQRRHDPQRGLHPRRPHPACGRRDHRGSAQVPRRLPAYEIAAVVARLVAALQP